jgi:two-component system, OmpR family, sensor histidine kinase CiaH
MAVESHKGLRRTTFTFWMLLFYIITALVWWFISLEKQNREIADKERQNLLLQSATLSTIQIGDRMDVINNHTKRSTTK